MENNHNPFNVSLSHEDIRILYRESVISEQEYSDALYFSGIIPEREHWRTFLQVLLVSMGTVFLLFGIIFFFAFNWQEMSKWQKFAGIETFIVVAALIAWFRGLESLPGKMSILVAGTLLGVLMAVYGQVYQTGADPYELFLYWGILLLPLVVATRLPAFWVMWLLIVNIALGLYAVQGLGGGFYGKYSPHVLLGVNLIFLIVWNGFQMRKVKWMQEPWTHWIVTIACLTLVTILAAISIVHVSSGWSRDLTFNNLNIALYLIVSIGFFLFFQFVKRDLFILALVIVSVSFLSFLLYVTVFHDHYKSGGNVLDIAFLILLEASLAAMWLRRTHLKWSVQA